MSNHSVKDEVNTAYSALPEPPWHDPRLLDFLFSDCNMVLEHADGSFMEHLQFGYELAASRFKGYSPRVLLLHSIMGLGTNHFPMQVEKIDKLRTFITSFEMRHIEAFPSFVRLWGHGALPAELLSYSAHHLSTHLQGITFHRVIDNKKIYMNAKDFWIHLNYQLLHYIDFIPSEGWSTSNKSTILVFLILCNELITVLTRAGKLMAQIKFEPAIQIKEVPWNLQIEDRMRRWQKISTKVCHSLEYQISWTPSRTSGTSRL